MDTAAWIGQSDDDLTPLQRNLALAAMQDAKEDADAKRDEAEKAAKAEDRREQFEFFNIQAGNPVGELSRARQALSDADDLRRDALDQLRRADAKVARAQSNIEFWSARLAPVEQAASRARVPSDPVEAAAFHAHEQFKETTRAMRAEVRTVSRSRPFGGGGVVRRSDPADCPHCLSLGASPEESFAIHHMTADGRLLSEVADRPVPVPDDTERAAYGSGGMVTRGAEGAIVGVW